MSRQLKVFIDRLVPIYESIKADIYLIATQWDKDKTIMNNTFEAIRGCTRDCFENCIEKGAIYGTGLNEINDVLEHNNYLQLAYTMGKNC